MIKLRVLASIRKVGRPYEPVRVIPAKGSGRRVESRNASIGITAFIFSVLVEPKRAMPILERMLTQTIVERYIRKLNEKLRIFGGVFSPEERH